MDQAGVLTAAEAHSDTASDAVRALINAEYLRFTAPNCCPSHKPSKPTPGWCSPRRSGSPARSTAAKWPPRTVRPPRRRCWVDKEQKPRRNTANHLTTLLGT